MNPRRNLQTRKNRRKRNEGWQKRDDHKRNLLFRARLRAGKSWFFGVKCDLAEILNRLANSEPYGGLTAHPDNIVIDEWVDQ